MGSLKGIKNALLLFVKLCSFAYIEWMIKMKIKIHQQGE